MYICQINHYHTIRVPCNLSACTILNVASLSLRLAPLHVVNGDINTILFAQKVREPKWLPSFNIAGAIFSLLELWLPCFRIHWGIKFIFEGWVSSLSLMGGYQVYL